MREQNAIPVYITQTSGYGINSELFSASVAIMEHCKNQNLECINLAKEIDLNYDDFYDELHLNPKGSLKVFDLKESINQNLFLTPSPGFQPFLIVLCARFTTCLAFSK